MTWCGWHEDDTECCLRLYNAGLTHREIALTMGKTKNQVDDKVRWMREKDYPLRVFSHAETVAKQDRWRRERAVGKEG